MKISRAVLIVTLALGSLVAPLAAEAQQPAKRPKIGILWPGDVEPYDNAFRQGLGGLCTF